MHPECSPEVTGEADYVGSTTGIMDFAEKSDAREFIIGTENSIVEHLQFACPEKQFLPAVPGADLRRHEADHAGGYVPGALGTGGEEILLPDRIMEEPEGVSIGWWNWAAE